MSGVIAPALARRLDRLARRAHAFHRFAHHPLCDRYASELVRLPRRWRVCRGCACALSGACAGAVAGAVVSGSAAASLLPLACAAAVCVSALDLVLARARRARLGKLWTRALPAAAVNALCVSALASGQGRGLALVLLLACAGLYLAYLRRGPSRTPCETCEERARAAPCSGLREIVRAERAFSRRAGQLLATARCY